MSGTTSPMAVKEDKDGNREVISGLAVFSNSGFESGVMDGNEINVDLGAHGGARTMLGRRI